MRASRKPYGRADRAREHAAEAIGRHALQDVPQMRAAAGHGPVGVRLGFLAMEVANRAFGSGNDHEAALELSGRASALVSAEGRGQDAPMMNWFLQVLRRRRRPVNAPDLATAPEEPVPAERAASTRPADAKPWVGVDLDGTLAEATAWKGMTHIGPPVPLMMRRVRAWLEKGIRVKIMTARAGDPEGLSATQAWLKTHGLPELEVTDKKDFGMIELWDDRAIQVVQNTGICFLGTSYFARPKAPILSDEIADRTFILVGSEPKASPAESKPSA